MGAGGVGDGVGVGAGLGGVGLGGGGGMTACTESMRAHVLVIAAALNIWALCWAEMALYMPMPTVLAMTALSIACV